VFSPSSNVPFAVPTRLLKTTFWQTCRESAHTLPTNTKTANGFEKSSGRSAWATLLPPSRFHGSPRKKLRAPKETELQLSPVATVERCSQSQKRVNTTRGALVRSVSSFDGRGKKGQTWGKGTDPSILGGWGWSTLVVAHPFPFFSRGRLQHRPDDIYPPPLSVVVPAKAFLIQTACHIQTGPSGISAPTRCLSEHPVVPELPGYGQDTPALR